jgi:hypothetical protein
LFHVVFDGEVVGLLVLHEPLGSCDEVWHPHESVPPFDPCEFAVEDATSEAPEAAPSMMKLKAISAMPTPIIARILFIETAFHSAVSATPPGTGGDLLAAFRLMSSGTYYGRWVGSHRASAPLPATTRVQRELGKRRRIRLSSETSSGDAMRAELHPVPGNGSEGHPSGVGRALRVTVRQIVRNVPQAHRVPRQRVRGPGSRPT